MTVSPDKPLSRRQLRETPRVDAPDSEQPTDQAEPDTDSGAPAFRTRDFRPEGRRSSFAPAFTSASLGEWTPVQSVIGRTDAGPDDVDDAGDVPSSEGAAPSAGPDQPSEERDGDGWNRPVRSDLDAPERTMTRRELRILRARAEAAGQPAPDVILLPSGETTVTGAIDLLDSPEPPRMDGAPSDEAPADRPETVDAELAPEADEAGVVTEQPVDGDEALDGKPTSADDSAPVIPALIEPTPGESLRYQTDSGPAPAEIVVEAEPTASESESAPAPGRLRPFDALFLPPSAQDGGDSAVDTSSARPDNDTDGLRGDILATPGGSAKPFGHWSTQTDDDGPHTDGTLSRDVGLTTGALTTHALVLPSIPDSGEPLLSPLTSTGEVMVTGTIDLPRSFGSTGAHPALFDHPDVDAIIDDSDRDESDAGIAPVRASRAVSSSTTTRSMIGTETEKKSRMLPILGIVGGGIVVVAVAAVVIVMFATNQF